MTMADTIGAFEHILNKWYATHLDTPLISIRLTSNEKLIKKKQLERVKKRENIQEFKTEIKNTNLTIYQDNVAVSTTIIKPKVIENEVSQTRVGRKSKNKRYIETEEIFKKREILNSKYITLDETTTHDFIVVFDDNNNSEYLPTVETSEIHCQTDQLPESQIIDELKAQVNKLTLELNEYELKLRKTYISQSIKYKDQDDPYLSSDEKELYQPTPFIINSEGLLEQSTQCEIGTTFKNENSLVQLILKQDPEFVLTENLICDTIRFINILLFMN